MATAHRILEELHHRISPVSRDLLLEFFGKRMEEFQRGKGTSKGKLFFFLFSFFFHVVAKWWRNRGATSTFPAGNEEKKREKEEEQEPFSVLVSSCPPSSPALRPPSPSPPDSGLPWTSSHSRHPFHSAPFVPGGASHTEAISARFRCQSP